MMYLRCTDCLFNAGITDSDDARFESLVGRGSDWHPDRYRCPVCDGVARFAPICDARATHYLTADELFCALMGSGLPQDLECSPSAVRTLLEGAEITGGVVRSVGGSGRAYLDSIELSTGHRLYLGASTYGACVYRVTSTSSRLSDLVENVPVNP